ncbi:MAG: undecaprenyldiphospho-muramoylpentapeptide beta-N-acetylglucosaminyltransferase [Chloracidobacterium sp.]|nr:undecaprenyldiphospho-muramoylpentapeptide beta-N-acetylglucosaminyltransferase [Chloracidobacterium sp.]MCO5334205.1 undecaprenyldiphospho-muramoylpentapeptide beta-N-acetylglucosaminyltransferase [Pyrinomonadaceae bacterium]
MKVLIAAGGTGGHIYPGIAVAKELMERDASSEVLFVGTARGLESRIVPDNGFQLSLIHSAGLKNVGLAGKLKGAAVLPRSFMEARRLLKDFAPDVVVGAGGYVSGPVLLTASLMRIPTLVMDSNALPGYTNRRLARFVNKAALTFEEALPFFGSKGVVAGNPVRKEFFSIAEREPATPISLLVFGGSQGSRAINNAVVAALPELKEMGIHITHQTGDADLATVKAAYEAEQYSDADVRPYISNMMEVVEASDIIISRAGATTCAELAAAGRAAIMIPLPGAADDHQRKNAEALVKKGAARMILQAELSGVRLVEELKELTNDLNTLEEMGRAARSLARPDASAAIADLIEGLAEARNGRK